MKKGTGKITIGSILLFIAIVLSFVVPALQKAKGRIAVQVNDSPEELAELMRTALFSTVGGILFGITGILMLPPVGVV